MPTKINIRSTRPRGVMISLSRNVLDNVKERCQELAMSLTVDEAIQKWINTVFKNWVVNEGPVVPVISLHDDAPEWARTALKAQDLFTINWVECRTMLSTVVDYFRNLSAEGQNFATIPVPEAIRREKAWHIELASKSLPVNNDEDGIEEVMKFPNGYTWVRVRGEKSLDREGNLMGHCVGSYFQEVSVGSMCIYSLRDAKNGPHITIELRKNRIVEQIKGKSNKAVIQTYRPMILPFLASQPQIESISPDESGLTLKEMKAYYTNNKLVQKVAANPRKNLLVHKIRPGFELSTYTVNDLGSLEVSEAAIFKKLNTLLKKAEFHTIPSFTEHAAEDESDLHWTRTSRVYSSSKSPSHPFVALNYPLRREGDFNTILTRADIDVDALTPKELMGIYSFMRGHDCLLPCEDPELLRAGASSTVRIGALELLEFTDPEIVNAVSATSATLYAPKGKTPQLIMLEASGDHPRWPGHDLNSKAPKKIPKRVFSSMSDKDLLDFFKIMKKSNFATMSRPSATYLQELREKVFGKEVVETKALYWKNLPKSLREAIGVFLEKTEEQAFLVAKKLDQTPNLVQVLRAEKLTASGYLYTYFTTFFSLLLMEDKKRAAEYIVNSEGLTRQVQAFLSVFASISAGAFYSKLSSAEQKKVHVAWALISKHLPQMLKLTADQKAELLVRRGSPAFEKDVNARF